MITLPMETNYQLYHQRANSAGNDFALFQLVAMTTTIITDINIPLETFFFALSFHSSCMSIREVTAREIIWMF
jgi:hypothetical protein